MAGIRLIVRLIYHIVYFISNQVLLSLEFNLPQGKYYIIIQYTFHSSSVTIQYHRCPPDIHSRRLSQSQPGPQAVVRTSSRIYIHTFFPGRGDHRAVQKGFVSRLIWLQLIAPNLLSLQTLTNLLLSHHDGMNADVPTRRQRNQHSRNHS